MPENPNVPVDWALIEGFSFSCRPDCGLCCYTTPALNPTERTTLIQLQPELPILAGPGGRSFVASRTGGGACALLSSNRCGEHTARPGPCQRFPLDVHLGDRIQISFVLSCPGITLAPLTSERLDPGANFPPHGLESEVEAVRQWLSEPGFDRHVQQARQRRRKIKRFLTKVGVWEEDDSVRARLSTAIPFPTAKDFPAESPPAASDGLELLPLYFDDHWGRVALAESVGGWEAITIAEVGGIDKHLGVFPPPESVPRLTAGARHLLNSYLRYFLKRDFLFGLVHLTLLEEPERLVGDAVKDELQRIGADVLTRAVIRGKISGRPTDPLTEGDVEAGIRAADMDLLDRPSWGNPP
ncbi:MAG: YkgJ family cysteine cluster protein [Thermoplasmata archaeon]